MTSQANTTLGVTPPKLAGKIVVAVEYHAQPIALPQPNTDDHDEFFRSVVDAR